MTATLATDPAAMRAAIHDEIVAIAARLDVDARALQPDESIPASGLIDSAGLVELVAWFELAFGLQVAAHELTVANLGTIDAMVAFAQRRAGSA